MRSRRPAIRFVRCWWCSILLVVHLCPGFALNHNVAFKHIGDGDIHETADAVDKVPQTKQ